MGEAFALALKFGVAALPAILAEYGFFTAVIAFVAAMPLGHLTLGVVVLLIGAFAPRLPGDDNKHVITVGKVAINGNARTAIMAAGILIIAGAIGEAIKIGAH
jgi:hypothetical protein